MKYLKNILSYIPVLIYFLLVFSFLFIEISEKRKNNARKDYYNSLNTFMADFDIKNYFTSTKEVTTIQKTNEEIFNIISSLNELISIDPENILYRHKRSILYERLSGISIENIWISQKLKLNSKKKLNILNAISDIEYALKISHRDPIFYHNLGWLYYFIGKKDSAFLNINRSINLDQGNPIFHLSLGILYETEDSITNSIDEYNKAICLSSEILNSKFYLDLKVRNHILADTLLNKIIFTLNYYLKSEPENPILLSRLGACLIEKGDLKLAKVLLEKSIIYLPNLPNNYYYLGIIFDFQKLNIKAKDEFTKAFNISHSEYMPAYKLAHIAKTEENDSLSVYYYRISLERYKKSLLDINQQLKINYFNDLEFECYIPKGLSYYSKPFIEFRAISLSLSQSYRNLENNKLSVFFDKYIDLYYVNPMDEIGNESYKSKALKAFSFLQEFD